VRRATDQRADSEPPPGQYVPAAFDRFWVGHLWIGVGLGQVAAVILVVYFGLTQDGPQRWLLVGLAGTGLVFNVGVALSAKRFRSPRARLIVLRVWLVGVTLGLALCAHVDRADNRALHVILTVPVVYAALTCSPAFVGALAATVVLSDPVLRLVLGGERFDRQPLEVAGVLLLCVLAVSAAHNRRSHERLVQDLTLRLAEQASVDSLTGLPNRRSLYARLFEEVDRSRRSGGAFLFASFDLDRFKTVNDTFGHAAGDEVLRRVARSVASGLRRTDFVARAGGDEFCVICPDTTSAGAAATVDSIRRAVAGADPYGIVEASVGVAVHVDPTESVDHLVARADQAMYVDKLERRRPRPRVQPDGPGAVVRTP
jgi:diguanylate cyclase (GGDEF)-like protein